LSRYGAGKTGIADVASEAGVSRQSRSLTGEFSRRTLAPVQARCDTATHPDFDVLADLMLRITLSLFILPLPAGPSEKKVRSLLSRWLTTSEWVR
jgi:hypothetical protein